MPRARFVCLAMWALTCAAAATGQKATPAQEQEQEQTVRISVLSLFHPAELRLQAGDGCTLRLSVGNDSRELHENEQVSIIRAGLDRVLVRFSSEDASEISLRGHELRAGCVQSATAQLWLQVPGKLRRAYIGHLEIRGDRARPRSAALEAIVTMPLETAVASVVAAESPPHAGIEALKAQAVAARSFLVAHTAVHRGFDYCDTTHCQFLRSPPALNSAAAEAARATAGLVLTYHDEASAADKTLAAMYARSCGGRTRTLREIGVRAAGYPYYAVHCVYCSRHPETWHSAPGSPHVRSERDRLAWNRIHGWGAIPSIATESGKAAALNGRGVGHGVGLCQLGAADMARHGAGFAQILAHYYPNTRLTPMTTP
jgi:stage II sporulation protein D